jgi:ribosomal protein S4E
VVALAFNPRTWEADRWISKFEASLVYRVSSRTARATQTNPVSKNQTKPKQNKTKTKTQNQKGKSTINPLFGNNIKIQNQ